MKIDGSKVFITGGCGFIGSHLIEALVEKKCQVTCLVEYNSELDLGLLKEVSPEITRKVKFVHGNLLDTEFLKENMRGCDYLFHLAAVISIPYSYYGTRHTVLTNVVGTLNVLQAAKETGIKKMVHTSTSETYGSAQYVPIDEKHPLVGQSPYSASKIGADKLAESFYLSFGLPVVTVRPFNCFGERQSPRAVIPTIIIQALQGGENGEIKLGNVHTTRDYTHAQDTAQGFICALETDGNEGQVFNISSNFEISIKEIAEKVIAQINPSLKIATDSQRIRPENSEVQRLFGDNTKARQVLGWQPQLTFDQGLERAIVYYQKKITQLRPGEYYI